VTIDTSGTTVMLKKISKLWGDAVEIEGFRLRKSMIGGSEDLCTLFTDHRVATLVAEELKEEWISYTVFPAKGRVLNNTEAAIGNVLVTIDRTTAKEYIRAAALLKLNKEEKEALGLL
jgi:hypothetical protein